MDTKNRGSLEQATMGWDERLIDPCTLGVGATAAGEGDLSRLVDRLIEEQMIAWPGLRDGLAAWRKVELRKVVIDGIEVVLQHNAGRIVSTSARVDEDSIRNRACFLCPSNMPTEEKGIAFGDRFGVFCNPFPVLAKHLVIISRDHVPQRLSGNLIALLRLAESLGPDFVAIYNGPASGASAPDHLHFQSGLAHDLPILAAVSREKAMDHEIEVAAARAYGVGFLALCSRSAEQTVTTVEHLLQVLDEMQGRRQAEPMVNVLVHFTALGWEVIVIPRERHRPAAYFADGHDRLVVSPAAIDLGGLLVVPREEDFNRLDATAVKSIYSEVTFSDQKLESLLESYHSGKGDGQS